MKKLFISALSLLMAAVLTACSGLGVEELLSAPKLTGEQDAIMTALDLVEGDYKLKYPLTGANRTPIELYDIDHDGSDEAIVCYNIPEQSVYARIAVLKKQGNRWNVINTAEGPGTEVTGISFIEAADMVYVLVEWQAINRIDHQAIAYEFSLAGGLSKSFEMSVHKLMVADADGDGDDELCCVSSDRLTGPFSLTVIECSSGGFFTRYTAELSREMLECVGLTLGSSLSGEKVLFVEENIGSSRCATQAFTVGGAAGEISQVQSVFESSIRPLDTVMCRLLKLKDEAYYVPEEYRVSAAGVSTKFYRWRGISGGKLGDPVTTYADLSYGWAVVIPDSLSGRIYASDVKGDVRRMALYEAASGNAVCEIKVTYRSESAEVYKNSGFVLVGANDRFSFYLKTGFEPKTDAFILKNFIVL